MFDLKKVALFSLCATAALAQAPQQLGYQGRLTTNNGTPEVGPVDMKFSFFSADMGGTALWEETQTAITLRDGFYATQVGKVTAFSTVPTLFESGTLWLEVAVKTPTDTTFKIMTPRQKVSSVAWALSCHSLKGGSVDAASISVNGSPVVSINTSGCTNGQLLQWNGTGWTCVTGTSGGGSVTVGQDAGTVAAGNDPRFGDATRLQSRPVSPSAPNAGDVLSWNGTAWAPLPVASSSADAGLLADNSIPLGKLLGTGCATGSVLQWNGTTWSCVTLSQATGQLRNAINFNDLTVEGTPIASGEYSSGTWKKEFAFDKNKEAKSTWFGASVGGAVSGNDWIGIDFGAGNAKVVKTVAVWSLYPPAGNYALSSYTLQRTSDAACASGWTDADAPSVGNGQVPLHWMTFPNSSTPARCWRLLAGSAPFAASSAWGVSEISMWSTVLPRPAAISNGDLATTYPKEGAFDGLEEPAGVSGWCASQTDNAITGTAWIGYDFGLGSARAIRRIVVNNWNVPGTSTHHVSAYFVERSDDCTTNWTTVYRGSSFSRTSDDQIIDLPANAGAGRCWRVRAGVRPVYDYTASVQPTYYWCLEEVEMYE